MKTLCYPDNDQLELGFQGLGSRKVVSRFDAVFVASDGGVLQLWEVEARKSAASKGLVRNPG